MDPYGQLSYPGEATPVIVDGLGYGTTKAHKEARAGKSAKKSAFSRGRSLNYLGVLACLIVPCVIFSVVDALRTFTVQYNNAHLVNVVCCALLVLISLLGLVAFVIVYQKAGGSQERSWLVLIFLTSCAAWVVAYVVSDLNYEANMQPYYDLQQLNVYTSVDPATYSGIQLMDAGRMTFTPGSHLDLSRSVGFMNKDTYCVAPVVGPGMVNATTYDLWAVGTNCCSGQGPDFRCGEYSNPYARSGLRLVDSDKKGFFRLAVQQAEADYNIQARHPVFLYWMQDPLAEINAYQDDGYKYFALGLSCFFLMQLLLVVTAAVAFSKLCG